MTYTQFPDNYLIMKGKKFLARKLLSVDKVSKDIEGVSKAALVKAKQISNNALEDWLDDTAAAAMAALEDCLKSKDDSVKLRAAATVLSPQMEEIKAKRSGKYPKTNLNVSMTAKELTELREQIRRDADRARAMARDRQTAQSSRFED